MAGSSYSVWRDIILTNSDNLDRAMSQLIQSLEQLRSDLRTRTLEEEFAAADAIAVQDSAQICGKAHVEQGYARTNG